MTRRSSLNFIAGAAVIPLTALAAGCGGGATASTTPPASPATTSAMSAASARAPAVHVANSRLGKILVDSRGRTLYLFRKDAGARSACFGACATFWPPLRASGKPTAGSGAKAALVGTTKRSDGKPQVTYNGHPLYTFKMDKKAGDTNGEGVNAFGGRWFAISASGKQISAKAPKPAAATPSPRAATPAAPKPAPRPAAPNPAPRPAAPPAAKPAPRPSGGIPQNGGGDGDSDNNGGPSDGDGNV
jgi:predicted lipoprotein with Yx(FWY)xxD motif